MKISAKATFAALLLSIFISACGSDSSSDVRSSQTVITEEGDTNETTTFLASNIVFSTAEAAEYQSLETNLDTETKILAENVHMNNLNNSLTAENVQDAFNESMPDLQTSIVGRWQSKSYNNGYDGESGSITFCEDGTFSIDSGVLSVIIGCNSIGCDSEVGVWELIEGPLIKVQLDGINPITERVFDAAYLYPLNYTDKKINFVRAYNLSVLTKEP